MNTEHQLRDRFASLTEPEALDADVVVGAAKGRKTRRDVLQFGAGTAAVGTLAGLTWLGWGQLNGQRPSPAGGPTGGPSGATPTDQPPVPQSTFVWKEALEWPVQGDPKTDVVYRVGGNLGFSYNEREWSLWDLTRKATLNSSEWAVEDVASAAVNNFHTGVTHSDGFNYWATLVPLPIGSVTMKLTDSGQTIVVSGYGLPKKFPFALLYWNARPGEVEAGGPFVMTLEPGPGERPVTIRLKA